MWPKTAPGTTYYLDCGRGDDDGSGTSVGRAWRSLAEASAHVYGPGDRLLLKRGTSCTGVPAPQGGGAQGAPVRIDAYGRGAKPHIEGAGARAAVHLVNTEQWAIRNLDISNTGPATTTDRRAGLLVQLTDYGVAHGFTVDGVDVHDVNGAGADAGTPISDTVSTYSGNLYWHTSQGRDAAAVNADPLFVSADPAGPCDVRLRAGSPARGMGSVTGGGPDYFGNLVSAPSNIGADQSS